MAAEQSTLYEDVRDIRKMLMDMGQSQARTEQAVSDLNTRLYNGGSGAIPVLFGKVEAIAKESAATAKKVDHQAAWAAGWASCAVLVIGAFKFGLAKLGWVHV